MNRFDWRVSSALFDDVGKQRKHEGQTYTLAKVPLAAWIATDDTDEACARLFAAIERWTGENLKGFSPEMRALVDAHSEHREWWE